MPAGGLPEPAPTTLRPGERGYPPVMAALSSPSRILRLLGDATLLDGSRRLAVVGTRNPSSRTLALTRDIVSLAVEAGWVVVSGLSPGVDVEAHTRALDSGGICLAVPGCGLGTLLDGDRGALARRVARTGLVVSVSPPAAPETPARRWWRNRVIAAFSDALVVTASEAGGGAWEAQRHAQVLGRRVLSPEPGEIAAALR